MPEDLPTLLALASIAFLGSIVYGLTGFGAALVTIPLATHFVPLPFALSVYALMDLGNALRIGLHRPGDAVKGELARMVPLVLVGTIVGVTALVNLPRAGAMLALGVFVLLYAAYSLLRRPGGAIVGTGWAYLAGFVGGITSTLFGAGGPPYAIYLSHRPLAKEQFRATLTLTTVFSIGMRVVAFALTGLLLKREVLLAAVAVLPAAFLGVSLASRLFQRVSHALLLRLVALLLLATGASLVARALG
ncbi:MAG: sulfite exporter TauE/SafE family protein [Burkholderiales bacterium]|nr:sulfite exporter TauE/SafE family protein [Burkholderiales bacterium]